MKKWMTYLAILLMALTMSVGMTACSDSGDGPMEEAGETLDDAVDDAADAAGDAVEDAKEAVEEAQ